MPGWVSDAVNQLSLSNAAGSGAEAGFGAGVTPARLGSGSASLRHSPPRCAPRAKHLVETGVPRELCAWGEVPRLQHRLCVWKEVISPFPPPDVFQPSLYFLFLAALPEHVGANFPPVKTTAPAAGARCSLPALTVIAVQHRSAPRPPADLSSNPAHVGKQPSAICGAGTAGQTEGRRIISLVLFSEEENSMEKCSDLPTPTQGACSSTAKSLPVGLEK